jgi:hypothetical protein
VQECRGRCLFHTPDAAAPPVLEGDAADFGEALDE